jgi:predicted amidohydrolase
MLKIAAIQMEPLLLDSETNLKKILNLVSESVELGAQLITFPECSLTGYSLSHEEARTVAEPIPGPSTSRILDVCQSFNILITLGMLEEDSEGHIYNTAVLLGRDGILGQYRKTHLPYLGVDRYLNQGDEITGPFPTPFGQVGLLICYDLRFPEPIRSLALQGAHLVLLPTNWPDKAHLYPDFMAQSRASENGVYLLAANRIGEERGTRYLGRSVIVGPDGKKLAEGTSDAEEILIAEVDLTLSEEKKRVFIAGEYEFDIFGDRRPSLYQKLVDEGKDQK